MSSEQIMFRKEEGIATVTLNRPERLNAVTPQMAERMLEAIEDANEDEKVKVLILTGVGRAFCSGVDLSVPLTPAEIPRRARLDPFPWISRLFLRLHQIDKPTIAAINGITLGSGYGLSLACDLRIAAESATFTLIFVRRGLIAGCGVTFLLPRVVGLSKAFELMWTGDTIDAQEAGRIGLVNRVVPPEELASATTELATRIARGPSIAIELMKRAVHKGLETDDFAAQLVYEGWAQQFCLETEDGKEGWNAFLEKREPQFRGR